MSTMPHLYPPALPDSLEWFNTAEPLTLGHLRGKVVILDFWTYCCINCMHVLSDLRYLEEKYSDSLVVIGLHTPKFANERVSTQVQKAINRYDIRHPVANDPEFRVWREYGVRGWPTLAVIDTEGYIVNITSGEGQRDQLDALVARLVHEGEAQGTLRRGRLPVATLAEPESNIKFPGKVHVFKNKLAISDSGHQRVLVTSLKGKVEAIYGNGEAGLIDGIDEQARFQDPQGLVAVDDMLYVADTGNHALRAIDLIARTVTTLAGTGEQGRNPGDLFDRPLKASLNSPWDLVCYGQQLYIAMAGPHQIWRMDLRANTVGVFAGSGREDIVDGKAEEAAFAQPSGLALGRAQLYVADSETSAIRRVDVFQGEVVTLVGRGLFEFGDLDGVGTQARLQHPLGLAYDTHRDCLWIADSYNHKIKKLDIQSNLISSYILPHHFMEPAGLTVHGDDMWVADTNNHQLVHIDLITGKTLPLEIHD